MNLESLETAYDILKKEGITENPEKAFIEYTNNKILFSSLKIESAINILTDEIHLDRITPNPLMKLIEKLISTVENKRNFFDHDDELRQGVVKLAEKFSAPIKDEYTKKLTSYIKVAEAFLFPKD